MERSTHNFLRVSKHLSTFPPEDEVEEVDSLCFVETLETHCKERWRIKLMINKMKKQMKQRIRTTRWKRGGRKN
jgi:hypothetical protein